MQITKFLSIPHYNESTHLTFSNYLSYIQLLLSMLTGLLLICITVINSQIVIQSDFQIIYLFTVLIITKSIIPINYICRLKCGAKIRKSKLQESTKIDIIGLFIPSFVKSLLYFWYIVLVNYLQWIVTVLLFAVAIIGVQILEVYVNKKRRILSIDKNNNDKNTLSYKRTHPSSISSSPSSCLKLKQIFIQLLLLISLFLNVQYFQLVFNIQTVIALCFLGVVCLLAFLYMHNQIFQLYQSDVDEVIAKQYPIQVFNFLLFCIMYYISSSTTTTTNSNNSTINLLTNQKIVKSPGFLFILEYPIHTIICVCFSILYQYVSFEILKKSSLKQLLLTQLTGLFWYNLYMMKQQQITTKRYFSTFINFIAIILLTRFIQFKIINKKISKFGKFVKNICRNLVNFMKRSKKKNNMVEEIQNEK